MSVIVHFVAETPDGKSLWKNLNVCTWLVFFALDQIPKIKISHMFARKRT